MTPEPSLTTIEPSDSIVINKKTVNDCPHQKIINLYLKNIPVGINPRNWDGSRLATLRTRWREDSAKQNLDWWDQFFQHISKSDFLTGKVQTGERRPFQINLPWILKKENFENIIDGKYDS